MSATTTKRPAANVSTTMPLGFQGIAVFYTVPGFWTGKREPFVYFCNYEFDRSRARHAADHHVLAEWPTAEFIRMETYGAAR